MAAIIAVLAKAKPQRALAKNLQAQADALFQSSNTTLGLADGQTMSTPGTGLFLMAQVRDFLLWKYKGQESILETYGFGVVISTAATPQRQHQPATK